MSKALPIVLTTAQLEQAVIDIATERPTVTYDRYLVENSLRISLYSRGECSDGTAGCIVGQAFDRCGVSARFLDKDGPGSIAEVLEDYGMEPSPFLVAMQDYQDDGWSWGDALEICDDAGLIPQLVLS